MPSSGSTGAQRAGRGSGIETLDRLLREDGYSGQELGKTDGDYRVRGEVGGCDRAAVQLAFGARVPVMLHDAGPGRRGETDDVAEPRAGREYP